MAEDMAVPGGGGGGGGGKKTSVSIEKIYQKKSQLEHILLRPDSYIGRSNSIVIILKIYCFNCDIKTEFYIVH